MKLSLFPMTIPIAVCLTGLLPAACLADETTLAANSASSNLPTLGYSSSLLPDAPSASLEEMRFGSSTRGFGPNTHLSLHTSPFSQWAIGMTTGTGGLGLEVVTPLATKLNLHVGASFLDYDPVLIEQTIPIDGKVNLRTISVGVDYFPGRGSFHITPGMTLYNGNHFIANTNIAPGGNFTINDTQYTSDPTDPVHGIFDMTFGKKVAPSLTVGFGNMLQRNGGHWSVPVDFGMEYIGQPKFVLQMTGSVCDPADGCTPIASDAGTQMNLAQSQSDVNNAISFLKFFPILKVGLAYRFGHVENTKMWR